MPAAEHRAHAAEDVVEVEGAAAIAVEDRRVGTGHAYVRRRGEAVDHEHQVAHVRQAVAIRVAASRPTKRRDVGRRVQRRRRTVVHAATARIRDQEVGRREEHDVGRDDVDQGVVFDVDAQERLRVTVSGARNGLRPGPREGDEAIHAVGAARTRDLPAPHQ
jgi:hypothetical protein